IGVIVFGETVQVTLDAAGSVTGLGGVIVSSELGATLNLAGAVSASGDGAPGVAGLSDTGDTVINVNQVSVTGDSADAVSAISNSGDTTVGVTGAVSSLQGTGVTATGQAVEINLPSGGSVAGAAGGVFADAGTDAILKLGGAVSAGGDNVYGVYASALGDAVINASSVSVTGANSDAIVALAPAGGVQIAITGEVSSAQGLGIRTTGETVEITVAAGAEVIGGTGGIQAASILGTTINLAGSVSSASGYAIDVSGGAATINNTGNTIHGAVSLTAGDDVLNNAGSWFAFGDSDFGLGDDLLSNSGLIQIVGAGAPVSVAFAGLETVDNAGLIDMGNGTAGDVLDLSSATFNGLAGGGLIIDVAGSTSDLLIVGDATGVTPVSVNTVGAAGLGVSAVFVQSGSAETGGEFVLDNAQISGFVAYEIAYDPATQSFTLTGGASPRVLEPLRFMAGAQNVWHKGGDAWSARMDDLRDAGRADGLEMWAQVFAGGEEQTSGLRTFTAFGAPVAADLSWEQEHQGFQSGFDVRRRGALWGLTTGMMKSSMRLDAGSSADYAGFNLGAYAGWNTGRFFINGLVKADWYEVEALMPAVPLYESFDGTAWGARIETGVRLGDDHGWFVEPLARLSWVSADLDGFSGQGATFEYDEAQS